MKKLTYVGNLGASSMEEVYPVALLCDECVAEMVGVSPDEDIVSCDEDDPSFGDTCFQCRKSRYEESLER